MKIAPKDTARFLAKPDGGINAVLIYGPDQGLVRERAETLLTRFLGGDIDPINLTVIQAERLRDDPGLLADEARAISLLGDTRAVHVRAAGDFATPAVKLLMGVADPTARVVIEAGELGGSSSLRRAVEPAKNAAALPCYREEGRDLIGRIEGYLRAENLRAERDALAYLSAQLGNDQAITRQEIVKLATYCDATPERPATLTLDDAMRVIGESAHREMDMVVMAVFDGDTRKVSRTLQRLFSEGVNSVAVLRGVARHGLRLLGFAQSVAGGQSIDAVINGAKPPLFFKVKDAVRQQLRHWSLPALHQVQRDLLHAELQVKSTGQPGELLTHRLLLDLAQRVRADTSPVR